MEINESKLKSKLGLGIALILLGFILVFGQTPSPGQQNQQSSTFASEPVEIKGFSQEEHSKESLPSRIIIPDLSIDLEVKEAKIVDGYWEVFENSAGWGEGSGLPGKNGNQVVFAHAREGLFLPLQNIKTGMSIYILTDGSWYQYQVAEIKEVFPNKVEVIAPTDDETLTLYTCSGFKDTKRLIVVAKRALE